MNRPEKKLFPYMRSYAGLAVLTVLAAVLAGCLGGGEDKISGRGTETENELYGTLVDASGHALAGARILAYAGEPNGLSPVPSSDSDVTDSEGKYTLRPSEAGSYNLVGDFQDGSLSVLIPEVQYIQGPAIDIGVDTLLAPGGIEGRVLLGGSGKAGSGKAGVMIFSPGTSFLAISGVSGNFVFPKIPEGDYRIRYLLSGYAAVSISNVLVRSGLVTRLADLNLGLDTLSPPAPPSGLSARLDTLFTHVALTWPAVELADLLGYRVYRDTGGLAFPMAVSGVVSDTQFTDTSYAHRLNPAQNLTLVYRIRTLDKQMNEGTEFSPEARVEIVSPSLVKTRMVISESSTLPGKAGIGKPVSFQLEYDNPTRRIRKVVWLIDSVPIRESSVEQLKGFDTIITSWSKPGVHAVGVELTDEAGAVWKKKMYVETILDAPKAMAGRDTSVTLGDKVELRPAASDLLGRVLTWEWDVGGSGKFQTAPDGTLDFQAPATPQAGYPCILRVTDDEGNTGLDTLHIEVIADAPLANIVAFPVEVFSGDTVTLSSEGSQDSLGRIVGLAWDIGAKGVFAASVDGRIAVTASEPKTLICILRVTDDDGQTDTARVDVVFHPRDRWILHSRDAVLQGIYQYQTWVLADQLWMLGSYTKDTGPIISKLFRTSDLNQWEEVKIGAVEPHYGRPMEFDGKIWRFTGDGAGLEVSSDGISWSTVSSTSVPKERINQILASHDDKLWILDTRDSLYSRWSEVWSSRDGQTWTLATKTPEYGFRVVVAACSWKGRLWVYGNGWSSKLDDQDLWSSVDGTVWQREATRVFPGLRQSVDLFVYHDELWMISVQEGEMQFWGDIWHSKDGKSWTELPVETPVLSDIGLSRTIVFMGRIWLFASTYLSNWKFKWEIWQSPH